MTRPTYSTRQARKAQRIAEQALAEAPPVGSLTDADLTLALRYYQGRKRRGPTQDLRLQALRDEAERRRKEREAAREIETTKPTFPWSDQ